MHMHLSLSLYIYIYTHSHDCEKMSLRSAQVRGRSGLEFFKPPALRP